MKSNHSVTGLKLNFCRNTCLFRLTSLEKISKIYEEGYEICRNTERVMEMFAKELYELDKNTVQYMIDEMQDTIDTQKEEIISHICTQYQISK